MKEKQSREGFSSHSGDGKRHSKDLQKKKKKELDPNTCRHCRKTSH